MYDTEALSRNGVFAAAHGTGGGGAGYNDRRTKRYRPGHPVLQRTRRHGSVEGNLI